jgi:predicted nucleic acid-binding protein
MKICLETSAIIGFFNDEQDCQAIEKLLTLAEAAQVELLTSNFAWEEQYKPLNELGNSRKERLKCLTRYLPKVARIGEWQLGVDVLGSDDSAEIESTLSKASRPDREQFLSYAALGLDFFVTKDKHYLKKSIRSKLIKQYSFKVGTPNECIHSIEEGEKKK